MKNEMNGELNEYDWSTGWMCTHIKGSEEMMAEGIAYHLWRLYSGDKEGYEEVTEGILTGIPKNDVNLMLFAFRLGAYNMMDCIESDLFPGRENPESLKNLKEGKIGALAWNSMQKIVEITDRIYEKYKCQVEGREYNPE